MVYSSKRLFPLLRIETSSMVKFSGSAVPKVGEALPSSIYIWKLPLASFVGTLGRSQLCPRHGPEAVW